MTGVEIAALAASAISAGAGTANTISAGKANKKGIAFAKEENAAQRQNQWDMWHQTNIYNSPVENMKRLKEAGINPHFYYGGSPQAQAAPVQSSAGGNMPNIRPTDFTPIAQAGQTMLQAEMMKAQIENIKADTVKKSEETQGITLSNGIQTEVLKNTPTSINLDNQVKETNIGNTKEQTDLTKVKIESEKQSIVNQISTNDKIRQEIDNLIATKGYTEQQTANLITAMALTRAQIQTEGVKQSNIRADTNLKAKEAEYKQQLSKTQTFVRSNLTANTAFQNANTKNLGKQYEILEENRKKYNRENYLGERYDLNDRRTEMESAMDRQKVIQQTYRNLQLDEEFKKLNISAQEWDNIVQQMTAPADVATPYIDAINSTKGSTTTTRYDSNGEYNGNSTTRRHR